MRVVPAITVALAVALSGSDGWCEPDVIAFPGASRAISHGMSASRDVGAFTAELLPRPTGSAGVDAAVLMLRHRGWSLRWGVFSLLEVESPEAYGLSTAVWRGLAGASFAVSADRWGGKAFGPGGALEATLSYRHESEHRSSGSSAGPTPKAVTGDFWMPDLAMRAFAGPVRFELRAQLKVFLPDRGFAPEATVFDDGVGLVSSSIYSVGPGGDFIMRWHLHPSVHPYISTFAEVLRGRDIRARPQTFEGQPIRGDAAGQVQVPDQYLVRTLAGAILPFEIEPGSRNLGGDLHVFTSLDVGHAKGVLKFREELRWGFGFRGVLFR